MSMKDNAEVFSNLRLQYPVFSYNKFNYSLSDNYLSFDFEFQVGENIKFNPKSLFVLPFKPNLKPEFTSLLENIIFNIGLVELVSYWKATCSPIIHIHAGHLSEAQGKWWKELYFNGLGEFFYLNSIQISLDDFVSIKCFSQSKYGKSQITFTDDYIVPVGGGKDSAVTLELLSGTGKEIYPLIINPRGATIDTVNTSIVSSDNIININRQIDSNLLKLNEEGYLNGHTPFSAMLAFYSIAASALTGIKNIALSNESSANESTIPGTMINHQYSKSYHFEKAFREYYSEFINEEINYFSFLRPLSEFQIVSIFSKLNKYHNVFKSCNVGSKENRWCGACPKCLFTHIMISAFKGVAYADRLLGAKMLNDKDNQQAFDELTGISHIKPFECVGTIDDVNKALTIIAADIKNIEENILVNRYAIHATSNPANVTSELNNENFLKPCELELLKQALA